MFRQFIRGSVMALLVCAIQSGCSTAPKQSERADVLSRAQQTRPWFEQHVTGLRAQIDRSAGYIVFPDVAQWGIVFGGGTTGRGVLFAPDGTQLGWTRIDNASVGLQAGIQGFRMLMVLENAAEVAEFKEGKWNGSASGVAVLGEAGASAAAPFQDGLAIYQGANRGLMAGVNVGLNSIRFEPLAP
jgi:lipid-binding SYLF domain-containing protein